MLHRRHSRDHGNGRTNFTKEQMGEYLADLRTNKPARPLGSRPPPDALFKHNSRADVSSVRKSSASSNSSQEPHHSRSSSSMSFYRNAGSFSSGRSSPDKMHFHTIRDHKHQRVEKEESHAVRVAMEALEQEQDDAAREEASELLRKHKRPHAPYAAPAYSPPQSHAPTDPADVEYGPDGARYRNGVEIRSEEIRAATSRSLRERSPNLPSPAFVSDQPERPIVSFDRDWKPPEEEEENQRRAAEKKRPLPKPAQPRNNAVNSSPQMASAPAVPTLRDMDEAVGEHKRSLRRKAMPPLPLIAVNDETDPCDIPHVSIENVPSIHIDDDLSPVSGTPTFPTPSIHIENSSSAVDTTPNFPMPSTHIHDDDPSPVNGTPTFPTPSIKGVETPRSNAVTPTPKSRAARASPTRPSPRHAATAPTPSPRTHHAMRAGSALCAQCALPMYGRTVTACGTRFHPSCFACYHCHEALECIQFYPEPSEARSARLERMQRRLNGESMEIPEGETEESDNDDSLRFYCHLDYHEFFSPRCRNCKTPIEGDCIVALGAEWHVGHFFCANCGDPFDQKTPFIEREGYAWCVNCHHNRTSGKCKKCRRPIIDTVLKALDAEWHEDCFRCTECNGGFEGGAYYLRERGLEPFCGSCEARRLKA